MFVDPINSDTCGKESCLEAGASNRKLITAHANGDRRMASSNIMRAVRIYSLSIASVALLMTAPTALSTAVAEPTRTVINLASGELPSADDVAALFVRWNDALQTGDPAKVAALYAAEGGVLLPTVSNKVRDNRAEIEAYFVDFLKLRPRGVIDESHVRILDDSSAIDSGIYPFDLTRNGKVDRVQARYSFLYRKIGANG